MKCPIGGRGQDIHIWFFFYSGKETRQNKDTSLKKKVGEYLKLILGIPIVVSFIRFNGHYRRIARNRNILCWATESLNDIPDSLLTDS
jgi:hypothetical protein